MAKNKVVFNCDIRDKDFYKSGSIVITQISEVEVKTQFLEGRSQQNFDDTFDDVYLNQLNLDAAETFEHDSGIGMGYGVSDEELGAAALGEQYVWQHAERGGERCVRGLSLVE